MMWSTCSLLYVATFATTLPSALAEGDPEVKRPNMLQVALPKPRTLRGDAGALRTGTAARQLPTAADRLIALRGGRHAPKFSDALPMASTMALHGLLIGGFGYQANSALGVGAAVLLVTSAALSVSANFPAYMAGVHLALLLQAGSAVTFGAQAARATLAQLQGAKMCGASAKLLPYTVMSASSIGALGAMRRFKPKKALP